MHDFCICLEGFYKIKKDKDFGVIFLEGLYLNKQTTIRHDFQLFFLSF
jgi:hypothetical protein